MILELVNGVCERYSNGSCLSQLHNSLIKLLVGKKAVILNVSLGYSNASTVFHVENIKHGLFMDNINMDASAPVCITIQSYKGTP